MAPRAWARVLEDFFRVRVRIHAWQPQWMCLPEEARLRLGLQGAAARLGEGSVLGARVWDCQSRIRIEIGPLTLAEYQRFLPGSASAERLRDWVLSYVGRELSCEIQLVLRRADVPATAIGKTGRLGWTSWLGGRLRSGDADDFVRAIA